MSQTYRASEFDCLDRVQSLAGSEYGNELSGSLKGGEFLDQIYYCFYLRTLYLSQTTYR
jgi:hypothetical protein